MTRETELWICLARDYLARSCSNRQAAWMLAVELWADYGHALDPQTAVQSELFEHYNIKRAVRARRTS